MNTVEQRAADTLLDKGVPISMRAPLLLRLFGKKRIGATIYNPTGGTLLKINSYYLSMGITATGLAEMDFNGLLSAQVSNHKKVYKAISCALLNNRILQFLFVKILAWWMSDSLSYKSACRLYEVLLLQGGIEDFTNIIGLGARLNMMATKTSQTTDRMS